MVNDTLNQQGWSLVRYWKWRCSLVVIPASWEWMEGNSKIIIWMYQPSKTTINIPSIMDNLSFRTAEEERLWDRLHWVLSLSFLFLFFKSLSLRITIFISFKWINGTLPLEQFLLSNLFAVDGGALAFLHLWNLWVGIDCESWLLGDARPGIAFLWSLSFHGLYY